MKARPTDVRVNNPHLIKRKEAPHVIPRTIKAGSQEVLAGFVLIYY
jgi:hypothetical protein